MPDSAPAHITPQGAQKLTTRLKRSPSLSFQDALDLLNTIRGLPKSEAYTGLLNQAGACFRSTKTAIIQAVYQHTSDKLNRASEETGDEGNKDLLDLLYLADTAPKGMTEKSFTDVKDYLMREIPSGNCGSTIQATAFLMGAAKRGVGNPNDVLNPLFTFAAAEENDYKHRTQALYCMIHFANGIKENQISVEFGWKLAQQSVVGNPFHRHLFAQVLCKITEGSRLRAPTDADRNRLLGSAAPKDFGCG